MPGLTAGTRFTGYRLVHQRLRRRPKTADAGLALSDDDGTVISIPGHSRSAGFRRFPLCTGRSAPGMTILSPV
jgi:hypothetical protein